MTKEANNTEAKALDAKAKRDAAAIAKIVTPRVGDTLETLREDVAKAAIGDYGATARYASLLTSTYGKDWHNVELPNKAAGLKPGDNMTASVFAERSALYDALRAKLHSNPSVVWARIKKHNASADATAEKAAKKEALASASDEEKAAMEKEAAVQKVKDLRERALDTLTALNAALAKVGGLSDDMFQCKGQIEKAIKAINPAFVVKVQQTSK